MSADSKPKRVRTGCLTCRRRHLKCDEAQPDCNNCRKSNRECRRGIELNFLQAIVGEPPTLSIDGLDIKFEDWSRTIADEYVGGESRYPPILTPPQDTPPQYPVRSAVSQTQPTPRNDTQNVLPPIQAYSYPVVNATNRHDVNSARRPSRHSHAGSDSSYLTAPPSTSYSNYSDTRPLTSDPSVPYVSSAEEAYLLNIYREEVGLWMDSMNPLKHFSEILPHDALEEPMLYQALLACGARHLTLVNSSYSEDKALEYYNTATTLLLRSLQNPLRDTVCCATTAVCLNVYEIMSESPMQRMNHIAGARALIKECGWDARSKGIGAACFWLNVGMEILSCLHFNWQPAWNPDHWQVDMNLEPETEQGREEHWVHRMLYIVGKISNLRASTPQFQRASPHEEQLRRETRYAEWQRLMELCAKWNSYKPKTMRELVRVSANQSNPKSCFPQINLTGRAAHVGQLFYRTAMCLLAQINPVMSKDEPEMNKMMLYHANKICSIVSHSLDRGIASVAIRSLAIAAECLTDRQEQQEVLEIFKRVRLNTGWRVEFISKNLKEKCWGWLDEGAQHQLAEQQASGAQFFPVGLQSAATSLPPPPPQPAKPMMPTGIMNPLLKTADFSLPNHPYQQHYQPPSQHNQYPHNY